jgi:hypothetical protein
MMEKQTEAYCQKPEWCKQQINPPEIGQCYKWEVKQNEKLHPDFNPVHTSEECLFYYLKHKVRVFALPFLKLPITTSNLNKTKNKHFVP